MLGTFYNYPKNTRNERLADIVLTNRQKAKLKVPKSGIFKNPFRLYNRANNTFKDGCLDLQKGKRSRRGIFGPKIQMPKPQGKILDENIFSLNKHSQSTGITIVKGILKRKKGFEMKKKVRFCEEIENCYDKKIRLGKIHFSPKKSTVPCHVSLMQPSRKKNHILNAEKSPQNEIILDGEKKQNSLEEAITREMYLEVINELSSRGKVTPQELKQICLGRKNERKFY